MLSFIKFELFLVVNFYYFKATEDTGGNILLVAHAGSLDTCTRQLVGKDPRPVNALMSIVRKVNIYSNFTNNNFSKLLYLEAISYKKFTPKHLVW